MTNGNLKIKATSITGFIAITISLLLAGYSFYLTNENETNIGLQTARIDNIINLVTIDTLFNRDSLINELKVQSAKDDLFLTQLNIQSDKYLLYISLLFFVIGLINILYLYNGFIVKIESENEVIKKQQEEWIEEQKLKYSIHEQRFDDLEYRTLKSNFSTYSNIGFLFHRESRSNAAFYILLAAENGIRLLKLKSNNENHNEIIERGIIDNLKGMITDLKDIKSKKIDREIKEIKNDFNKTNSLLESVISFEHKEIKSLGIEAVALLKAIVDDL